jgi:hypothetical protein
MSMQPVAQHGGMPHGPPAGEHVGLGWQTPSRHRPSPLQTVLFGLLPRHRPFLRFLQGGQFFFLLFLCFFAAARSVADAPRTLPTASPSTAWFSHRRG